MLFRSTGTTFPVLIEDNSNGSLNHLEEKSHPLSAAEARFLNTLTFSFLLEYLSAVKISSK